MLEISQNKKIAYSVGEMAEMASVSASMIRKEIRAGRIPIKRCGRRVLITEDDFLNYLNGVNDEQK